MTGPYIKSIPPEEAEGPVKEFYDAMKKGVGFYPKVFQVQSLRPDLAELSAMYIQRLMIEDHEFSRSTKELIACYVSKINSCEY